MKATECKKCGAQISFIYIKTKAGDHKWHPVNLPGQKPKLLDPDELVVGEHDKFFSKAGMKDPDQMVYWSHYSTCPAAEAFRKKKKAK
jgi:hypothetical protein